MNPAELKNKFKALWKDTFRDSDAYVSLVFDSYFNPDLVAYEEMSGDIVAALLGVPYEFGNADRRIRGLYLCGLATKPQFRSRGIMTRLLASINEKAARLGYAFTFLIPADKGLRKYYHDRDYVNAFYRISDNYTSIHDFNREYESILMEQKEKVAELKRRYFASLTTGTINREHPDNATSKHVAALIRRIENEQGDCRLYHSDRDIEILIKENMVSNGDVIYVRNSGGDLTAAAFVDPHDRSEVKVLNIYFADLASRYKVLGGVKAAYPDAAMSVLVSSVDMDRKALWQRTYAGTMPENAKVSEVSVAERVYSLAAHSKVYGMARILNLHEILKFQASIRNDVKYSILVKGEDSYIVNQINVADGKIKVKKLTYDELTPSQAMYVMSQRDVSEILFRLRDADSIITEALGIPSINASACLLLD